MFFSFSKIKILLLHADKHESLLQIDSMVFMGIVKHYQCFQNSEFASKFPTSLILSLLLCMTEHSQITHSNKLSICLQYLKKEVRNGGHFWHADKRLSF